MTTFDCSELCRLCLVKDRVKVPIFEGEGDARQVSFKIGTCLPIKVTREDRFPKQVCEDCINKLDLVYDFWTTTVNSERQLSQWVGDAGDGEDKQGYVSITDELMKQETAENRLMEGSVMNQNDQNTNININMMDQMGLTMPIIISNNQQQQQQQHQQMTMQGVSGTSSDANQRGNKRHHEEVEASDDEGDIEGLDNDDAVKSEDIDGTSNRPTGHEPTFVSIACDDGAGPSGLQQQKMDMSDMIMTQADVDPKSGYYVSKLELLESHSAVVQSIKVLVEADDNDPLTLVENIHEKTVDDFDDVVPTDLTQCALCGEQCLTSVDLEEHIKIHMIPHRSPPINQQTTIDESQHLANNSDNLQTNVEHLEQFETDGDDFVTDSEHIQQYGTTVEHYDTDMEQFVTEAEHGEHFTTDVEHLGTHLEQLNGDCEHLGTDSEQFPTEHLDQDIENIDNDGSQGLVTNVNFIENQKVIYVCQHCGRSFNTQGILRKHLQQIHNISTKLHKCEQCDYTSQHKQNVINHMRRHNQEYKYTCEDCGAGFYARNIYNEHKLIHSGRKPFQCEICNATFRYKQGLRLHAKLHQPDYVPPPKKHHCKQCNKRFSRKQVLLVHMKTHGGGGPLTEYVCHICGKSVSSKTYLTVHVRKHTGEKPHVCDLCGKGFISQNYLSVHRRTHTGERPHKCTHCDKSFTQRTTLVVHLRGHTGDRPYPCPFCQKSFASKTMLNSHLKTHAKQNARAQQEQQLKEEEFEQNYENISAEHIQLEQLQAEELVEELQGDDGHNLDNVTVLLPA